MLAVNNTDHTELTHQESLDEAMSVTSLEFDPFDGVESEGKANDILFNQCWRQLREKQYVLRFNKL